MGKIPDYTALTAPADDDQLLVVDVSDTTDSVDGSSRSLTLSSLLTGGLDADLGALTASLPITVAGTGTNPGLAIQNTGGSAGEQRIDLIVTSTGLVRLRHRADDGSSNITNIINIDLGDDSVDMTDATSVAVPAPTAATHALAWGSDAEVAALTATGGVLASGGTGTSVPNANALEVINTNAASGEQRFKLSVTSSGAPRLDTMSDDGTSVLRNYFMARSDGEFRMTANTSVSVPAPTAATHALAWGSDAEVAALTATGDIDINKTNPLLLLENPGGGTDEKIFRIRNATGSLTVQSRTDANGTKQNLMTFDSGTGGVTVNQSLTVPAVADGATSAAAQVTARDSGTGQLAIAGIELGDTGWRDVSSFLLNGWTGTLEWRRIGNDIIFRTAYGSAGLDGSAATSTVFLKPDALGVGCYWDTAFSAEARVLFYRSNGALIESEYWYINQWHAPGFGAAENKYGFFNGNEVRATARNDQGWPTSLPGTAA